MGQLAPLSLGACDDAVVNLGSIVDVTALIGGKVASRGRVDAAAAGSLCPEVGGALAADLDVPLSAEWFDSILGSAVTVLALVGGGGRSDNR